MQRRKDLYEENSEIVIFLFPFASYVTLRLCVKIILLSAVFLSSTFALYVPRRVRANE
jgi:hypothetical protein